MCIVCILVGCRYRIYLIHCNKNSYQEILCTVYKYHCINVSMWPQKSSAFFICNVWCCTTGPKIQSNLRDILHSLLSTISVTHEALPPNKKHMIFFFDSGEVLPLWASNIHVKIDNLSSLVLFVSCCIFNGFSCSYHFFIRNVFLLATFYKPLIILKKRIKISCMYCM